jgi:outer membrane protein assembly factor BamD
MHSLIGLLVLLVIFSGCSSDEKRADTPEGAFAIAQDFEKSDRYEEAIRRFGEVKTKFPYSKYATMAELAIADTYYKQESFAEAQISYQTFKDLHPKHPQIDYVTFRLGMSFFKQLPSTSDRDLTLSSSAILFFDELIERYPRSEHFKEASEKRLEALKMLGEKEEYIADFYFKRKKYDSALNRYEGLLAKFGKYGFEEKALSRLAQCSSMLGDQEKLEKYKNLLKKKYPDSKALSSFKGELN